MNKHITIVRNDSMVFNGLLKKVNDREIVLQNMRLSNVTISFNQISELYIDTKAAC